MHNQTMDEASIPINQMDPIQKRQFLIKQAIKLLRKDMQLLIEFAIGERTLNGIRRRRTVLDDQRLLWCLTSLRKRIDALQKQLKKNTRSA
jgi:hypothetical protein